MSGQWAARLHGTRVPRDWVALGNNAVAQYTSDYSVLGVGFVATFSCVDRSSMPPPPPDPCSGSGVELTDSGPVAHRDLDNGQDCRWSLSCTNNALSPRLHFTSFNTEANFDFVYLFDSATASGSAAETLHGNTVPWDWVATSSVAVVQYTSDGSVLRDGFVAQFDCVNAQSVPPPPPPRTPVTPAWDDWGWGMQPQGDPANECDACLTDCTLLGTDIAIGRPFVVEGASVMASAVEACAGSDWMVDI